jgi:hypothetical protein
MSTNLEHQVSGLRGAMDLIHVELQQRLKKLEAELAALKATRCNHVPPVPRPQLSLDANGEPTEASMAALRASRAPATLHDLAIVAEGLGEDLGGVAKRIQALEARRLDVFGGLARRVDNLESRRAMCYEGVWAENHEYKAGDCVTWGGSLWVALEPGMISQKPGTDGCQWRLAVKRGQA